MLSRLDDERVFHSHEDIVFRSSRARVRQRDHRLDTGTAPSGAMAQHNQEEDDEADADRDDSDESDDDGADEEAQRRRRRLVAASEGWRRGRGKRVVYQEQPMAFVYLPNGDIRPRDECPPGMALPALPPPPAFPSLLLEEDTAERQGDKQTRTAIRHDPDTSRRAEPTATRASTTNVRERTRLNRREMMEESSDEEVARATKAPSSSSASSVSLVTRVASKATTNAQSKNTKSGDRDRRTARYTAPSPVSSSSPSPSGSSAPSPSTSNPRTPSSAEEEEEKPTKRNNQLDEQDEKQDADFSLYSKAEASVRVHGRIHRESPTSLYQSARRLQRPTGSQQQIEPPESPTPMRTRSAAAKQDARRRIDAHYDYLRSISTRQRDDSDNGKMRSSVRTMTETDRDRELPSINRSTATHTSFRPPPLSIPEIPGPTTMPSPAQLDQLRQRLQAKEPSPASSSENRSKNRRPYERLEEELQKEKQRVLEKMTILLEEQAKTQQLTHKLETLEARLMAKDAELKEKLSMAEKDKEEALRTKETRWKASQKAIEDELHVKSAQVIRLESETKQLREQLKERQRAQAEQEGNQKSEQDEAAKQVAAIRHGLSKFRFRVEQWKGHAKEALDCCDKKTTHSALLKSIWADFPALETNLIGRETSPEADEGQVSQNMVSFLKKRLRVSEDELHQTKGKYAELKELCARQCVREADLQNFINEHRLRGNLVIGGNNQAAETTQEKAVQWNDPVQTSRAVKTVAHRGTNTPTRRVERELAINLTGDVSDDSEDEEETDYLAPRKSNLYPTGRDTAGLYSSRRPSTSSLARDILEVPRKSVERVRILPSVSSIAHRYERAPASSEQSGSIPRRRKTAPASTLSSKATSRPALRSASTTKAPTKRRAASVASTARTTRTHTSTLYRPWV